MLKQRHCFPFGPAPETGANSGGEGLSKFQDMIEIKNDNHRILTSQRFAEDGKSHRFVTAHYLRKT
jgi:hypothetical protein